MLPLSLRPKPSPAATLATLRPDLALLLAGRAVAISHPEIDLRHVVDDVRSSASRPPQSLDFAAGSCGLDAWSASLPALFADDGPAGFAPAAADEPDDVARAVVLMVAGADEAAHEVAQSREGTTLYDHAHAIMHRREADFGNARYWARRISRSPVFHTMGEGVTAAIESVRSQCPALQDEVADQFATLAAAYDPLAFLEIVERAWQADSDSLRVLCQAVQFEEMVRLVAVATGAERTD